MIELTRNMNKKDDRIKYISILLILTLVLSSCGKSGGNIVNREVKSPAVGLTSSGPTTGDLTTGTGETPLPPGAELTPPPDTGKTDTGTKITGTGTKITGGTEKPGATPPPSKTGMPGAETSKEKTDKEEFGSKDQGILGNQSSGTGSGEGEGGTGEGKDGNQVDNQNNVNVNNNKNAGGDTAGNKEGKGNQETGQNPYFKEHIQGESEKTINGPDKIETTIRRTRK